MQAIEWTNELLIIAISIPLASFVIGFLIAFLIGQSKLKTKDILNENLNRDLEELSRLQDQHDDLVLDNKVLSVTTAELRTQLKAEEEKFATLHDRLEMLEEQHKADVNQWHVLQADHTQLKTSMDEREKHYAEQLKHLDESKAILTNEFQNLANKIFDEKSKKFADSNKDNLDILLKPFREQIEGFQKRVNEVHDASIKGHSDLNAEIKKVLEIGSQMSDEANNLTTALKGDSKQRGIWGEVQLERTLQLSGLRENDHYESEANFKNEKGKNYRPDYLIKLPDDKHIVIDSKVSLVAYDRAVSAETPEESSLAMDQHVEAVKKHIDELASKDYTNLIGIESPSFVLMFMPVEPAYIDALKHNRELFEYGYSRSIVLVSHTTLIPILRTVSNLWMIERSNKEAREISDKAGEIFNTVCTVAERLDKLGGTLKTASNHYNDTVRGLVGQQGLYGKVQRFTELSTRITKTLPDLSSKEIDVEKERLELVVEEITEVKEIEQQESESADELKQD